MAPGRLSRLGAVVLAVGMVVILPGTANADTAQSGCATMDPFTPALAAQLATRWPGQRFSASIYDQRTGCQFDLHPDLRLTTASVLKVEVMAGILLRAQSQGRPLSDQERSLILPMITQSHDAPTTALWQSLGGAPGMTNLDSVFGMTGTTQIGPEWGVTVTTARDQVRLLRQVLLGDFGPIGPSYRAEAFNYMTSVIPSQRWGITAGVPAGWAVANKNGFAGSNCCAWRINSTGAVYDPSGGAYAIAILSDGWPDQPTGIAAVETVNRAVAAQLARPRTPPQYFLRNSNTSGGADQAFSFGNSWDRPLVGDWNGDKRVTAGVDRLAVFWLRNSPGGGGGEQVFTYGNPGDEPIVGDWNGDGIDTIGIRRGSTFYLRNSNSSGIADIVFSYGNPGDQVVVGDWNGDGVDTIGVRRGTTFYLRNSNSSGIADIAFDYGNAGDLPVAGHWAPGAPSTIGVFRPSAATFYLRGSNTAGIADIAASLGNPGDAPVVGDWTGAGVDTIGVIRTLP